MSVSSPSASASTSLPEEADMERSNLFMSDIGTSFCSLSSCLTMEAPMSVRIFWTSTIVCPATDTGTRAFSSPLGTTLKLKGCCIRTGRGIGQKPIYSFVVCAHTFLIRPKPTKRLYSGRISAVS